MESHQDTIEAVEAGQQTISQILLGLHDEPTPDQTHQEVGMISESGATMALDVQDGTLHVQRVQAVTLHDGRTAFLDTSSIQGGKITPGQTLQLEDGTTAVVQAVAHEIKTHESIPSEEQAQDKFTMEHGIQLEDGTTAYIQNAPKEGLQAVHLEDGTATYSLFPSDGHLDTAASMSLQQLTDVQEAGETTKSKGLELDKMLKTKVEASEKVFKCTFQGCNRTFPTQHHYKVHERSHSGDRPFKCEFPGCEKAFGVAYSLKSHYRVHTGEKPYKCPEKTCPKAFKTSGDLQKHVRTHTGERPFKCPFEGCGAAFTTSNIRKVHIRTHTGERPYVCPESGCGRSFASATNYKNHVRIHSGERPYVCTAEGCNKSFTEYSSLYKHHVVHTHSKPYACKHCGKNYRQTSTLSMHTRTVHAEVQAEYVPIQVLDQAALDKLPPLNKDQIEFMEAPGLAGPSGDGLRVVGSQEETDNPLVINTAEAQKQVTMVTPHGVSVVSNEQALIALQATQQAAQLAIQQIQQSSNDAGVQQIYVITDPNQLEIMQQHLSLQQNQAGNSVTSSAGDSTQLQLAVCTQTELPVSMTQISVADEVHYAVANTGGVDTLVEAPSTVLTDHVHSNV